MKVMRWPILVSLLAVLQLGACNSKQPVVTEHHAGMLRTYNGVQLTNLTVDVRDTIYPLCIDTCKGVPADTCRGVSTVNPMIRHRHISAQLDTRAVDTTGVSTDARSSTEFYSPRDIAKVGGCIDWPHVGLILGLVLACLILILVLVRR